jgi:energy-coupling factor transporter ATP-binding protein EcfA2/energy-coupling factor transporter transmembrane protein EcfT
MNDARAWLIWALTVLLAASYSRNPLHSVLLLLVTLWVNAVCAVTKEKVSSLGPLCFALVAIPAAAIFNTLATHVGETVLVRLPGNLPLIGGPITLEALVFGALNGLSLTVILSGFTTFSRALRVRDLVRLTPRAFHETGVVMSIALTFAPQTVRSLERIREAQAVRGHRLRGLRDWLPVITPLLVGALERAFTLAEAMMARGYATVAASTRLPVQAGVALGLLTLLGGWLGYLFVPTARGVLLAILGLGGVILLAALVATGRSARHTVYRPQRWRVRDTAMVVGCIPVLIMLLTRRDAFYYSPYPRLGWPVFDLGEGEMMALMGRNGAGKTTLLRCIVGLLRPQRGRISLAGRDLAGRETAEVCRDIGYLPQSPDDLLFADTVADELTITLRNHGLLAQSPVSPDSLIERLGLAPVRTQYPRDLSVGQRQRVALGAITVTRPRVLLLDEPTRGLDYQAKQILVELLLAWQTEGTTVILTTHDVELAAQVAGRVVILSNGEIVVDAAPKRLVNSPLFSPQIARLFPGRGWLTPDDVLHAH